jgi:hypothetical protein
MNFLLNGNKRRSEEKRILLTLSTCWYSLKSKFDNKIYLQWIKNILSIVNNFNLIIYTDSESFKQIIKFIYL